MKNFDRDLMTELQKWIKRREIYAIKGPRQSGKTTILKMLKQWLIDEQRVKPENIIFLTFEDRDNLEKFSSDPKGLVRSFIAERENERFYFLIDEFQYLKDGGQKLKFLYDIFENVKFIITGSSSLELKENTGKFLVGRVFSFYLYQLSFEEFIKIRSSQLNNVYRERKDYLGDFIFRGKEFSIPQKDVFGKDFEKVFEEYTIWGGYPEVVKAKEEETKRIILKNIYDTYINRDIIELLKITDFSKLKTLLLLLANRIGNLLNYNDLGLNTHTYFKEVKHYLSILEETFVINLLKPFFTNKTTELKKNPKIYFMDTGFRNYLLHNFNELSIRPDKGAIVENTAFTQLKIKQKDNYQIRYWRTLSKAEVDFILQENGTLIPIEVKYSEMKTPQISRAFRNFLTQYKPKRALILTKNFWGKLKVDETIIKFIPVWYL